MLRRRGLILATVFILIGVCIIQALYYPFLRPEAREWWNIGPLAGIGLPIAIPVLLVWEEFFKHLPFSDGWYWLLTTAYVSFLYCVTSTLLRRWWPTH